MNRTVVCTALLLPFALIADAVVLDARCATAAVLHAGDILVLDEARAGVFVVDRTTGARGIISSSLSTAPVGGGPSIAAPEALTVDALGNIFVTGGQSEGFIVHIDPATGDRKLVSSNALGSGPRLKWPASIVVDPGGGVIVGDVDIDNFRLSRLLRIDRSTGDRTIVSGRASEVPSVVVGAGPDINAPVSLIAEATGSVVALDWNLVGNLGWEMLRVDLTTGDRTVIPNGQGARFLINSPTDAYPAGNGRFFISGEYDDFVVLVDPATNNRTYVTGPSITAAPGNKALSPTGLALEDDGQLLVAASRFAAILRVDPATGQQTLLTGGSAGSGPNLVAPVDIAIVPAQVPEPAAIALVGMTLAGLAGVAKINLRQSRRRPARLLPAAGTPGTLAKSKIPMTGQE